MQSHNKNGIIKQIIGPVVDVYFEHDIPAIRTALTVVQSTEGSNDRTIVLEVVQHVGLNRVRAIAMSDTTGLTRDLPVVNTGAPISTPVGEAVLGRLFNVLGKPVDGGEALPSTTPTLPIHQKAPAFKDQKNKN
jgi:F-type H+-transporting ATPase subunit beta